MGIDTTAAGKLIAEQMDAIEKDYEGRDGFEIGAVVTIVEVHGPDGAEFRTRYNTGGNPFLAMGVMEAAKQQMLLGMMNASPPQ